MKLIKDKKGRVQIPAAFDKIEKKDLQTGDILLFYGGNKLTAWHGRNRKKKYGRSSNPPYHAAIVYKNIDGDVLILDQELQSTLSFLQEYGIKKSVRIDVIRPPAPQHALLAIQKRIKLLGTKEKLYDWKGYFSFLSQMPALGWARLIKPSKSTFYCSDIVAFCWSVTGIPVSPRGYNFTAPVDLQLYGMGHYGLMTLKIEGEIIP